MADSISRRNNDRLIRFPPYVSFFEKKIQKITYFSRHQHQRYALLTNPLIIAVGCLTIVHNNDASLSEWTLGHCGNFFYQRPMIVFIVCIQVEKNIDFSSVCLFFLGLGKVQINFLLSLVASRSLLTNLFKILGRALAESAWIFSSFAPKFYTISRMHTT
jgi:hypothetical protein